MSENQEASFEDFDVEQLDDEELASLSGGQNVKYCPMGTIKFCDKTDGVRKCWCEPIPGYKPLHYDD